MAAYEHTQHGKLHLVVWSAALLSGVLGLAAARAREGLVLSLTMALVLLAVGFAFRELTVRDAGDHLDVRFGPLPLFRATFRYAEMTDVAPGRTTFWQGWGIHGFPGRCWVYNIWGCDCVKFRLGAKKQIFVGTDDPAGLAAFLQGKAGK